MLMDLYDQSHKIKKYLVAQDKGNKTSNLQKLNRAIPLIL